MSKVPKSVADWYRNPNHYRTDDDESPESFGGPEAWQMQKMFGKEEEPGLESDPLTDEEAEALRKLRDWTPPRAADDKIH